jgi:hypothetical protein
MRMGTRMEQKVCFTCLYGFGDKNKGSGVLKQFSEKYPTLSIEITNQQNTKVIRIRAGRRLA